MKIPTDRRQTSWLLTDLIKELNKGLPRNNSSFVVIAKLESATSGFRPCCLHNYWLHRPLSSNADLSCDSVYPIKGSNVSIIVIAFFSHFVFIASRDVFCHNVKNK